MSLRAYLTDGTDYRKPERVFPSSAPIERFKFHNKSDAFVIVGEVAGFDPDEIKLAVNDNVLTISGKHETVENDDDYVSKDMSSFSNSYNLPHGINADKIVAEHKNGILTVRIPKVERPTKEIPIKRLGK